MLPALASAIAIAASTPAGCPFESPCVFVEPGVAAQAAPGTVQTFRGREFAPRSRVEVQYGSYCPPEPGLCAGVGRATSFRTDRKGNFTFRFRFGNTLPPGAGPKGAGSEEVRFSGRSRGGRQVLRYGVPPPAPSTPAQRAAARRVRDAVRQLERSIARRRPVTGRALNAQQGELQSCSALLDAAREAGERQQAVVAALLDATVEAATFGVDAAAFAAFAGRLEALALPRGPLADGVAAWITAVRTPRYVPRPGLCDVVEGWRQAGFAPGAEPLAPDTVGLGERIGADPRIAAAADALRDLGIRRADVDAFRGDVLGLERYITF